MGFQNAGRFLGETFRVPMDSGPSAHGRRGGSVREAGRQSWP